MTSKLDFYNLHTSNRNIYINDEIFTEISRDITKQIDLLIEDDKKNTANNEKVLSECYPGINTDFITNKNNIPSVNVYVDSPGGSIYSMFTIYDKLKELQKHCIVKMYGTGFIASAAIMIFLSIDKKYRVCTKNTTFLIHQASDLEVGTLKAIEEQTAELKRLNNLAFDIIMQNTSINKEQLEEVYEKKKDWIIPAEEALKLGIVSEII
jgi:ATP-dependent protease ClpP protease subunit